MNIEFFAFFQAGRRDSSRYTKTVDNQLKILRGQEIATARALVQIKSSADRQSCRKEYGTFDRMSFVGRAGSLIGTRPKDETDVLCIGPAGEFAVRCRAMAVVT
jgi:hypothetical protein